MTYNNQKQHYNSKINIDWSFFHDIPVEEVADILGLDVNARGWFICPSHNDTKPSAQIRYKTNRWCCYACGDGHPKTSIDLVMAVMGVGSRDAVLFLDQYYHGGIKQLDNESADILLPPYISSETLKELGIKINPYAECRVSGIINIADKDKHVKNDTTIQLSYEDATALIIDKIIEYTRKNKKYAQEVIKNFPDLDSEAKSYIVETMNYKNEKMQPILNQFLDFQNKLIKLSEKEYIWGTNENEIERELA